MSNQNKTYYKLTETQKGLLWSQIFTIEPHNAKEINILNAFFIVPINCNFDALEKAFNKVIEMNDSLRLRIVIKGLGLRQYFEDFKPRTLEIVKIEDSNQAIENYKNSVYSHKMKMLNSDLVWAQMASFGTGGILLMRFQHLSVDGYSLNLILKSIEKYYDCFVNSEQLPIEKSFSITKFFEIERKYLESTQYAKDKAFWKKSFYSQRNYKFPAGRRSEFGASKMLSMIISDEEYMKFSAFCHNNNCTSQAALMSLTAILTYALKKADNFCLYSITHNRITPGLKQTVGAMMNSFPTFIDIDVNMTVNEFTRDLYICILNHMSHARFPLSKMNKYIYKESIKNFFNFFHPWIMFSTMDFAKTKNEMNYKAGVLPMVNYSCQFYCSILEAPGDYVEIILTYQKYKYKEKQIRKLIDEFRKLLHIVLENPDLTVEIISNIFIKEIK